MLQLVTVGVDVSLQRVLIPAMGEACTIVIRDVRLPVEFGPAADKKNGHSAMAIAISNYELHGICNPYLFFSKLNRDAPDVAPDRKTKALRADVDIVRDFLCKFASVDSVDSYSKY